ncbi:cadherin-like domain-containing protein, partial [Terasakiella pusilla]|uniref:cadherin-like domain-containing protein n=1 Tax=Terasakiella pusilla TaxID=64973 RepID=UPI003AA8ECB4
MADDQGKRPEDQNGVDNSPNVQTGNEEDAVLLDELTALQNTEDQDLEGVMQGRENAGGDALGVEDMGYLSSVHQGGFSTEQEVLAGILPTEEDAFANDQDVVVDDEASDYIDGEVPETPFVSPEAERLDFDILDDSVVPEKQQAEDAPVQEEEAPADPAPEQEQDTSDVFADTITPQALPLDEPIIETPEEDELLGDEDNLAPTAGDDKISGREDQPITFSASDLLGNDTDVDGDTLTIIGFDQPENGTIVDNLDGTYTFTPNENWNGETDFTYTISDGNGGTDTATVTIDVDGVNDGPVAKDDTLSGTEDQPITFSASDLLGNDTDVDGDTLTIIGFDQPENGTIVGNGDGTYTFTPNENWNGETDFTYT